MRGVRSKLACGFLGLCRCMVVRGYKHLCQCPSLCGWLCACTREVLGCCGVAVFLRVSYARSEHTGKRYGGGLFDTICCVERAVGEPSDTRDNYKMEKWITISKIAVPLKVCMVVAVKIVRPEY